MHLFSHGSKNALKMGLLFCLFGIYAHLFDERNENQKQIDYNWVPVPLEGLCDQV